MGSPATISVDDDFSASKTSVTLRTTNNEQARRLDLVTVKIEPRKVAMEDSRDIPFGRQGNEQG